MGSAEHAKGLTGKIHLSNPKRGAATGYVTEPVQTFSFGYQICYNSAHPRTREKPCLPKPLTRSSDVQPVWENSKKWAEVLFDAVNTADPPQFQFWLSQSCELQTRGKCLFES
jgi:hypothetical protein